MQVVLIDARNSMYRNAHVGRNLHASSGQATGAVHGLLMGMLALKKRFTDAKFVVVWDGADTINSWRGEVFSAYKANRRVNVTEDLKALRASVVSQIGVAKQLFDVIGVSQIEIAKLEADDMIGILSEKCAGHSWPVTVYSNDQDYLQLMAFGVDVLRGASERKVTAKDIKSKWSCDVANLLKLRALLGDHSDGIPRAVPGVGPVAAAHYISAGVDASVPRFEDLPRAVRQEAVRLESYWPTVHMNWRLMKILRSCGDPDFPQELATAVTVETRRVLKELSRPAHRDAERYQEMLTMLAVMELSVAIENRREIYWLQVVPDGSKPLRT